MTEVDSSINLISINISDVFSSTIDVLNKLLTFISCHKMYSSHVQVDTWNISPTKRQLCKNIRSNWDKWNDW